MCTLTERFVFVRPRYSFRAGHGYGLYSGLPQLYLNTLRSLTVEGDNNVLGLQVARCPHHDAWRTKPNHNPLIL